jgi:two-component system sensor histidine kinase BaeS
MRTKLFLAFFVVILTALVSNFIFKRLIDRDFDDYVMGTNEDRLYWVLASVEGSYSDDDWDTALLGHYLHWAAMLGFEAEVRDPNGKTILNSNDALESLTPTMRRRIQALIHTDTAVGDFEEYPLFVRGKEIGSLLVRPLSSKGLLREKEIMFKNRLKDFLLMSFLIAGAGAFFLSVVFSLFLTRPIKRLKRAAESVAGGDLGIRVGIRSSDEIGKLSETFNHMVESLEREEALRQRLTSNVAHELRTPLAIMKANLEGIRDGVVKPDKEVLESIDQEVERLINLVEGIEDITKAEESFFKISEPRVVNLRELLDNILQGLAHISVEKGINLDIKGEKDIAVNTDVEKLETITRNIISNALVHTSGGSVSISYGKDRKDFFIEVADSGPGIPEGDIPLVFKRFYKGEVSRGIGLGLAISKELVDIMGGRIQISSTEGKGTTVRVSLPEK